MKKFFTLVVLLISFNATALEEWRTPEVDNLVYLQLENDVAIIELAPFMAPKHVAQFKALVREGFYDGLDFYRVIDGFVAQGGDLSEQKKSTHKAQLAAEFTRQLDADSSFFLVQSTDFIAAQTGFLNGFSAGRDLESKQEWLLHCPGVVAMARDIDANSATTDFYITIGQSPRHLDQNMSVFGRIIYGMPGIQALLRANINNPSGVIEDKTKRSLIVSARLASDIPLEQRIKIQIQNERSQAVTSRLASARLLDNEFFHFKGNGNLDICYYQLKSRQVD
jgi:peptidylprolyl isomerase